MLAWLFSSSDAYDALAETLEQPPQPKLGRNADIRRTRMELVRAAQATITQACASQPSSSRRLIKKLGGSEKACVLLSLLSVDANFDSELSGDEEKAFVKMADRVSWWTQTSFRPTEPLPFDYIATPAVDWSNE